jgi:hypothetical protein
MSLTDQAVERTERALPWMMKVVLVFATFPFVLLASHPIIFRLAISVVLLLGAAALKWLRTVPCPIPQQHNYD